MKLRNISSTSNIMPDLTSGINKTWGEDFISICDAWLYINVLVANGKASIFVDDKELWQVFNNDYTDGQGSPIPLSKGSKVTYRGNPYPYGMPPSVVFYPCKGAI